VTRAVIRIHIYTALLTLVNLLVYTTTAVYAALRLPRTGATLVQYREYQPEDGETDRQTAERVVKLLGLSLATPVQSFAIQHPQPGQLVLDFYHANGRHKVTVLPGQMRIEITRNTAARYLDVLHVTTGAFRSGDWRMQLWAYENEFALWCFLAMLASAVWMAAARFRWLGTTQMRIVHLAAGALFFPFGVLFGITALQIAHYRWFQPIAWASRLHRTSAAAAAGAGILVPILAATGICLWYQTRPRRSVAVVLATAAVTLLFIVWMRK
jgi:hypothetical protein